jgi:hypothetical protein
MMRRPPSHGRLLYLEVRNVLITTVLGLLLIAVVFGVVVGAVAITTR